MTTARQREAKKRQYLQRVVNIDRGSFTPLVFATNGMVGKECDRALKALVSMIVSKNADLHYSCGDKSLANKAAICNPAMEHHLF